MNEDESVTAVTLETPDQLREAIAVLAQSQVELEARVKALTQLVRAMDTRQKTVPAQQDAKTALQQRLIDSHEHQIATLEMMQRTAGARFDAE